MRSAIATLLFVSLTSILSAQSTTSKDSEKQPTHNINQNAVFDRICLGDAHKEVTEKLRASKLLELAVNEVYLGRLGLNGSYRTKKTIGGLKCLLYFDWDSSSNLKELTMQTQPQPGTAYDTLLQNNWKELLNLMTTLYGKPLQSAGYPASSTLQDDMSLSTHIWHMPAGGTAMLGTSKSKSGFMVMARFTTEIIKPKIIRRSF